MRKGLLRLGLAVLAVAGLALPSSVNAEEGAVSSGANSLRLSPSGTRLVLTAGKTLQGDDPDCVSGLSDECSIEVYNPGTVAFNYKVYVTPYAVTGSNNELSFSGEVRSNYTQISRWIDIQNTDGDFVKEATFRIEPGETKKLQYRVVIPEDIPGGSQYAVIWAQILNDNQSAGGIQTVGQVGTVITGRSSGESIEKAEVFEMDMTRFAFSGPLHASAKVNNVGNTDFVVNYSYTAKTFFGKEVYSKDETLAAYPETNYEVAMDWEDTPMLGIFRVDFKISAAGEEFVESHVVVIMPLIVLILLILLLTIVIVWIIIIIRKRKERKARTLV